MSETTTTTDMPTDTEIRTAMTTLDRMICAAEDSGLFSTKTIEELSTAYGHMDHIAKFVTTVEWPIELPEADQFGSDIEELASRGELGGPKDEVQYAEESEDEWL